VAVVSLPLEVGRNKEGPTSFCVYYCHQCHWYLAVSFDLNCWFRPLFGICNVTDELINRI